MSDAVQLKGSAWTAEPLSPEAKEEHLRQAETRFNEMQRLGRAYRRTGFVFGTFGMTIGALGMTAWLAFPRTETVARFFTISEQTGEVLPALAPSDAPRHFSEAVAKQHLRLTVEAYDGYRFETAASNVYRCALMLSPEAQARYNAWFTARNPEGPQARFGRTGTVRVEAPRFRKLGEGRGGVEEWEVRYRRVETREGNESRRDWRVTVMFSWRPGVVMTEDDRSINAAGFQALEYTSQAD